jgi:PBP1b-binding outer membrane lipoprotein LpoB
MCARTKFFASLSVGLTAVIIVGCASSGVDRRNGEGVVEMRRDERGFVHGTGIESQDIVAVTDKMARGIMAVPEIANAQKVPRIVLLPLKNDIRFPFNKDIFLDEIMARLNEQAAGKVRFHLQRTGQMTSDTDPNIQSIKGADFLLTGKVAGQTTKTSAGTRDYVLYSFELINPNTSEVIWNGSHRIKKQGQTDATYR